MHLREAGQAVVGGLVGQDQLVPLLEPHLGLGLGLGFGLGLGLGLGLALAPNANPNPNP